MRSIVVLLLATVLTGTATAQTSEPSVHVFSLREFALDQYRIDNHRDSYLDYEDPDGATGEHWIGGIAAEFTIDFIKRGDWGLYFDNRVHSAGTNAQIREVGWRYDLGLQLGPDVQAYWAHHSRHVLDAEREDRFPLDNSFGVRATFYRRDK